MAKPASTERNPGLLQRLVALLPKKAPAYLLEVAKRQDELNRYLWMQVQNSLPRKHAPTHLGGNDNLVSANTPTTVTVGALGSPGTPQGGVAAANHEHPVVLDFTTDPIPETGIQGNPSPPFKTLKQQTNWLNSVAARDYAMNIFKAGIR